MKEGDEGWLDFKAIKEKSDARTVLSHFGLLEHLDEPGSELVGWCPFGSEHGKDDSFSVNIEKKAFQCFACKARGSLLDLVAKLQNATLREAAHTVLAIMEDSREGERQRRGRPYGKERAQDVIQPAVQETPIPDEAIPAIMSFVAASPLILRNKLDPAYLLVVDMRKVGLAWVNPRN